MLQLCSGILWFEEKSLAFGLTGWCTFFKFSGFTDRILCFWNALLENSLGKVHMYLNPRIIFYIKHSYKHRVVFLKLHRLITDAVQQIVDAVIFLLFGGQLHSRKTLLTGNPLLRIPSSTKNYKSRYISWVKQQRRPCIRKPRSLCDRYDCRKHRKCSRRFLWGKPSVSNSSKKTFSDELTDLKN